VCQHMHIRASVSRIPGFVRACWRPVGQISLDYSHALDLARCFSTQRAAATIDPACTLSPHQSPAGITPISLPDALGTYPSLGVCRSH
jgi:hypothetical protein